MIIIFLVIKFCDIRWCEEFPLVLICMEYYAE